MPVEVLDEGVRVLVERRAQQREERLLLRPILEVLGQIPRRSRHREAPIFDDGTRSAKGEFVKGPTGADFPLARVRERRRQGVTVADAAAEVARADRRPLAPPLAAARAAADLA